METLYAIGMLVGLMKAHAEPPKVAAAPPPIEQHRVVVEKPQPRKKPEWLLDY
jgi:hypothetical protein